MNVSFNGSALRRRLELSGCFTRPQVDTLVNSLQSTFMPSAATSDGLRENRVTQKPETRELKTTMQTEIQSTEADLRTELQDLKLGVSLLRVEMNGRFNVLYFMCVVMIAALVVLFLVMAMH